jgi:hypothetical protein
VVCRVLQALYLRIVLVKYFGGLSALSLFTAARSSYSWMSLMRILLENQYLRIVLFKVNQYLRTVLVKYPGAHRSAQFLLVDELDAHLVGEPGEDGHLKVAPALGFGI